MNASEISKNNISFCKVLNKYSNCINSSAFTRAKLQFKMDRKGFN